MIPKTAAPSKALNPLRQSLPLKIILIASAGSALEFYDFIIYAFLASSIQDLFFSVGSSERFRLAETFGIFGAAYLTRPLGGVAMAHFGDRYGRKRVFTFSILLMALPTLGIGLLPTYSKIGFAAPLLLLSLRLLQGAAIGGEAPGGWVYVSEHAPRQMTGLAIGLLTSGLTMGVFLGSCISLLLNTAFTKAELLAGGWRIPFLLGGVFGLVGLWLRRYLVETPLFQQMQERASTHKLTPIKEVMRNHKYAVGSGIALTWMLTASVLVVIIMAPSLLSQLYHLPVQSVMVASLMATFSLSISNVLIGHATDRLGLRAVAIPSVLFLIATTYVLYAWAGLLPQYLILMYALAGLGCGAMVLTPICIVRLFPTHVRFTGVSLSYNMSYAILGGVTPPLMIALIHFYRLAPAHYVAFSAICVLPLILMKNWKSPPA